ncbi:hypothetical protein [Leptolyngbya sp. FACHB-16]|uniref:hypothetical protein n=1 Tax=unclassified Leptolyngbya TaxID=2650499 RepID=UPI001684E80F|nr:hypothetical protein [Leptolyngbya sp. FACHB-16]MBD1913339.1 hypothetical protein [Leptolyngbya sp. FACHB-8]MBD2154495.1 hypothetical protein [Leptolyngbya sp. FACHB-16]
MTFSVQTPPEGQHHPHLACPKCSINSVVQHGGTYVCLNCGFRRNVFESSKPRRSDESAGATTVLIIVATLIVLWVTVPSSPSPNGTSTLNTPTLNEAR